MSNVRFSVDYAKRLSKCKKCKQEIVKGGLRLAKIVPNFFHDDDEEMKQYYHAKCLFETFSRSRATTRIIETSDDIEEFQSIDEKDKKILIELIDNMEKSKINKNKKDSGAKTSEKKNNESNEEEEDEKKMEEVKQKIKSKIRKTKEESDTDSETESEATSPKKNDDENCADNTFETFQTIANEISEESSHLKKTSILRNFFKNGIKKNGYKGNMYLFLKLLLPGVSTSVYNLNSKQLVKLFSKMFSVDLDEMTDHLNKGDVSETCRHYFSKSNKIKPAEKSTLTLNQVDNYLEKLTKVTKEQDQLKCLEEFVKKCTKSDLRTFIRLIKKDLRIDAGAKVILEAVDPNAYAAYQVSRDLKDVIARVNQKSTKPGLKKDLSIRVNLMTAVKPMLADACKSVEQAFLKCKNGILAEIKYDGERLQLHKNGAKFDYFSRNLKGVQQHKVAHLKEFIPKAFPKADSLILDGEILLYDTKGKKPLPFGSLGVHKKNEFKDATVCLFVFDCIFLNGKDLMKKPLIERRKILEENMTEIHGRIMFSEQKEIKKPTLLRQLMMDVINEGLEGLVLKDTHSVYEPGKRHWLKMKKDYLDEGQMADTADLVVLGAYYGTGNKGGMKSVFLMGVLNEKTNKWYTVTKVGNGFDDKTLEKLQKQIEMEEIKKNYNQLPDWLVCHKSIVPDFVVKNPKKSPVWELTGAEFSKSETHTADGISIRFPRVTRVRDDKSWKEATNLERLNELFKLSKEKTDVMQDVDDDEIETKVKCSPQKMSAKRSAVTLENNSDSEDEKSPKKTIKIDSKLTKGSKTEAKCQNKSSLNDDFDKLFPSIFSGKKFYLTKSVPKFNELKRYIITFDGEILDEKLIGDATHIIVSSMEENISTDTKGKKMTDQELWKCIKNKKFIQS